VKAHKYALLLLLLLGALIVQSIAFPSTWVRVLNDLLVSAMALAVLLVLFQRRHEKLIMMATAAALIIALWAGHLVTGETKFLVEVARHALMAAFLGYAMVAILGHLMRSKARRRDGVLGALSGYLIAAGAWAHVNILAYLAAPKAFSVTPDILPLMADVQGRTSVFNYYSLAQMLTLNYSDITPVAAPATTLSMLQGLFGVFYLAVVVSELVKAGSENGVAPDRRS
jgi:hypothetical protein